MTPCLRTTRWRTLPSQHLKPAVKEGLGANTFIVIMILRSSSARLFFCLAFFYVSVALAASKYNLSLPRPLSHTRNSCDESRTDPTSFCKCTCFSNSTIIQLGPPVSNGNGLSIIESREFQGADIFLRSRDDDNEDDADSESKGDKDNKKFRSLNCNDCNRKLCMEHQLPKCKGATEEDIVTTCFRTFRSISGAMPRGIRIFIWCLTVDYTERDSSKDQAVVFIFIIATAGLLLWAAVKPWVERWIQVGNSRVSYCTIPPTWAMAVLTKYIVEQNRQLENAGHTSLFPHRRMAIDSFIPSLPVPIFFRFYSSFP